MWLDTQSGLTKPKILDTDIVVTVSPYNPIFEIFWRYIESAMQRIKFTQALPSFPFIESRIYFSSENLYIR